jgi:hypothetical protein
MCCLPIDQLSRLIKDEPEWKRGYNDGRDGFPPDAILENKLYFEGYTVGFGEYTREQLIK